MFGLGLATKIYVAVEAVDMRKGFEGLYGLRALAFGDLSNVSARRMSKEGRTPKAVAMLNRARTDGDAFPCSKRPI